MRTRPWRLGFLAIAALAITGAGVSFGDDAEYRLNESASDVGTTRMGGIYLAPKVLTTLFGTPVLDNGDPGCVGIYRFVGPENAVVTISFRSDNVSRDWIVKLQREFWVNERKMLLDVGARSQPEAGRFIEWVMLRAQGMASNKSPERTREG